MSDRPRIGVWLTRTDPYWVQINEAVYLRGQQLSADLIPLEATMEFAGTPDSDPGRLVEDILSFGLSALITSYIPKQDALRILEAGLPIVHLSETDFTHSNLVAFAGLYDSALLAGKFVAERLNGKGRVLVIGGLWEKDGEVGNSRVTAIADVFKNFPALNWQHIPAPWVYEQAYPVIVKSLKTISGDIHAIVGISDPLALAAHNAGRTLGRITPQTIIVGINGDPLALAAVADGSLTATVETDSANFGREAMDIAYELALGNSFPRSLSIHSALVTVENVGELALKKLIAIADIPSRLVGVNREAEQYRIKQLETVTSINQQVGGLLDRQKLFNKVAELIAKNYHYNRVVIYRWHDSARILLKEYPRPVSGAEGEAPIQKTGLIGQMMLKGESIFIPDVVHSLHYAPDLDYPQTRSRAILPIRYNQKIIGVLDLHSSRRVQHLRHELLGLQLLADQLGIASQNASLYEESLQARSAAEKADQLKTRLLANVSHELRAPINVILGYTQTALKEPNIYGVNLPTELRRDQQQIYQSGEHLVRLINDLLDMSRLEIGELDLYPEMLEPRLFLKDVFNSMADTARRTGVEWRLELPESLPLIQADPVRLRQIFLNLLSNASKFTTNGLITLGADVEPPHLHLWVRDTGAGIPPEAQQQVFEPFYRVENLQRRPEGIGLGLSITRRLVALHNGSMSLESRMGTGSTFHIYLPLPGLNGLSIAASSDSNSSVLLLISHNPDPSPAILQLCQRRGLSLERITSAEEVSRLSSPSVLAWDMNNAHPDDWELIGQLRRSPAVCRLPFVIYNQTPGSSGLTNILVKPVPHATLLEMLNSLRPERAENRPVLMVDDDAQVREMYARLVAEALPGVPIQSAEDGQFALDMLETITPCLVLLDLMMPRVDGFTVLEYMRSNPRLQTVPVLVMSGKLLTEEDAHRLDYARVVFQSKDMLSEQEALVALRSALRDDERLLQATSAVVKQALAYLHQHYAEPLSRQQIARAVGVSEGYLSKIFKQEMGISPWDALNRFRIQRARELLKTTDGNITEIAAQVGFDDPSYFGRVFQQQVGLSPKKYREQ